MLNLSIVGIRHHENESLNICKICLLRILALYATVLILYLVSLSHLLASFNGKPQRTSSGFLFYIKIQPTQISIKKYAVLMHILKLGFICT